MKKMNCDEGVMLIGHGSRSEESERVFKLQARRLADMGFCNVYVAFNEVDENTIERTLEKMADDGVRFIYAVPLFIISGVHVKQDIPKKLGIPGGSGGGTVTVNNKSIMVKYADTIGDDPLIADLLAKKICGMRSDSIRP